MLIGILIAIAVGFLCLAMSKLGSGSLETVQNLKHQTQAFYASDGVMTVMCQEILNGNGAKYLRDTSGGGGGGSSPTQDTRGQIYLEWFGNIAGSLVSNLTSNTNFLNNHPDSAKNVWRIGSWFVSGEISNYGFRYRGYVHPPITGNYIFRCCANGEGKVYLSSDENPSHLQLKVQHSENVTPTQGSAICDHNIPQSTPISLTAGNKYYIECLFKGGNTTTWFKVGWIRPDGVEESPLRGSSISSIVSSTSVAPPSPSPSTPPWTDSIWPVGNLKVQYQVSRGRSGGYEIRTDAYKDDGYNGRMYSAPLKQAFGSTTSQTPDAIYIPVIFYDFHAGPPNPDFEPIDSLVTYCPSPGPPNWWCPCPTLPCKGNDGLSHKPAYGFRTGLVQNTLDAWRKPVPTAKAISDSMATYHIERWFRPSGAGNNVDASATFFLDVTDSLWKWTNLTPYLGRTGEYVSSNFSAGNFMANVVIYDSLLFLRNPALGPNYYEFKRDESVSLFL